jgi:hypothetical protein
MDHITLSQGHGQASGNHRPTGCRLPADRVEKCAGLLGGMGYLHGLKGLSWLKEEGGETALASYSLGVDD